VLNQIFNARLVIDGIIGKKTINAINRCEPETLFDAIKAARINYYHTIARKGKNHKFLKGWLKRIGSFEYKR